MKCIHNALIACLGVIAVATIAQAGNRLYVGNLSSTDLSIVDKSTSPPTELVRLSTLLTEAHSLDPGDGPVSVHSTIGVLNPGPDGYGDAGIIDVFYDGPPGGFPSTATERKFIEYTPAGIDRGIVREDSVINFDIGTSFAGGVEVLTSHRGEIDPGQPGLTFSGLSVVPASSPDPLATSFFDIFTDLHFDGSIPIRSDIPLYRITITSTAVPEPATLWLLLAGILTKCARRRATMS